MNKVKDKELLAVIAAAIAAYSTDSNSEYVVRSVKRVPQTSPVWNVAGRLDLIKNKLN